MSIELVLGSMISSFRFVSFLVKESTERVPSMDERHCIDYASIAIQFTLLFQLQYTAVGHIVVLLLHVAGFCIVCPYS